MRNLTIITFRQPNGLLGAFNGKEVWYNMSINEFVQFKIDNEQRFNFAPLVNEIGVFTSIYCVNNEIDSKVSKPIIESMNDSKAKHMLKHTEK